VQRKVRLSSSTDIQRVRRFGKSFAHPLLVLVFYPNELGITRAAFIAGRSVGNAVARNRAKRLLREALRSLLPNIAPGHDLVLVARQPLTAVKCAQAQAALTQHLKRAHLYRDNVDGEREQH
jgi:ribonuclease P protein component